MLRTFLDGDTELVLCDTRTVDSDHKVYLFVKLLYVEEYDEEWAKKEGPYHVQISAVSEGFVSAENVRHARESMGLSAEQFAACDEKTRASILLDYGIAAALWNKSGHNKAKLLAEARKELGLIHILFGFYMDKQANAIGATGWDFIRGEPTAPLYKKENVG